MPAEASVEMEQLAAMEGCVKHRAAIFWPAICHNLAPAALAMVTPSPVLLGVPQGKNRMPGMP